MSLFNLVALGVFGLLIVGGIPALISESPGLMDKSMYIKAVLVVFGLLILSRIPAFITGDLDGITIVSTVVELGFFVWGILILRK